jgi:hypothetical protein
MARSSWKGQSYARAIHNHFCPMSQQRTSNQALERTADRRKDLLSMISALNLEAQLARVSGRSASSR